MQRIRQHSQASTSLASDLGNTPPAIAAVIKQYAPIALLMDEFFQKLQKSKSTPYPATQLEKLLITSLSGAI